MKCPNPECEANIPDHEDRCPGCGTPVEVPNVRAARKREEREALARRLDEEETAARQRGCEEIIERFRDAISRSQAVLIRPLGIVQVFLEDNRLLHFIKRLGVVLVCPKRTNGIEHGYLWTQLFFHIILSVYTSHYSR